MRRMLSGALCVLLAAGCDNQVTINDPAATDSYSERPASSVAPVQNPGFAFLPPLAPWTAPSGQADGTLLPDVIICEQLATGECGDVVAVFSAKAQNFLERVFYEPFTESYNAVWKTDRCLSGACNLSGKTVKLRVLVGNYELGNMSISIVARRGGTSNAIVSGLPLLIRFRIEQGAVRVITPNASVPMGPAGGVIASADGVVLNFSAGALPSETPITIAPVTNAPAGMGAWTKVYDLGPDGTQFSAPVTLTMPYDAGAFPENVGPHALAVMTWDGTGWQIVEGSVIDDRANTISAPIEHFSVYAIGIAPNTINGVLTPETIAVGGTTSFTALTFAYQTTAQTYCHRHSIFSGCHWHTTQIGYYYYPVGLFVQWISSNPSVAEFAYWGSLTDQFGRTNSAPLRGIRAGTSNITARAGGKQSSPVLITVVDPVPATIYAPTNRATLVVQKGQQSSVDIPILNSGGGTLSGLWTGPLADYYNGAPAPWATASLSSTTAPSTMTIRVAPGANVGAGVHTLQFGLYGPGATNSPLVFYVNATVIAAEVTPVNATIVPNPSSVAITVARGSAASADIAITNSGTDPLTNLTAGGFSNYYDGGDAPWVTASFDRTTAPATLTITARPDAAVPLGQHLLRFTIASPGATNSPYTFYTIPVTVTANDQEH